MITKNLKQIEKEIDTIKNKIHLLGEMRPGTLTLQYKDPKKKEGGYYQLSYTLNMKSRTEYIRPIFVKEIRKQAKIYKKFKKLIERWVTLSIEYSHLKMEKGKRSTSK